MDMQDIPLARFVDDMLDAAERLGISDRMISKLVLGRVNRLDDVLAGKIEMRRGTIRRGKAKLKKLIHGEAAQ